MKQQKMIKRFIKWLEEIFGDDDRFICTCGCDELVLSETGIFCPQCGMYYLDKETSYDREKRD